MKYSKIFALLFICSFITMYACNDKSSAVKKEARESLNVPDAPAQTNTTIPPPPPPTTAEPAQNAAGVWHYTCGNGCAGGAGAAGNCATCGGTLAHNAAYHNNTANTTTSPITTSPVNPTFTPPTPPKQPEPAQNASGVWHYTCAKGCAGGSGAKGNCGTCGGALAHNQAYHQ
ncbi:MAG: hypothetical protein P1U56_19695 [Saprospiraceae bacterium]|nr:hypothetical protein [Saprospiraceae bacterium]